MPNFRYPYCKALNITSCFNTQASLFYFQLFFTLVFDIEAVVKIICFGPKGYFRSSINKYEAFLALMTTFNTIYSVHAALRSFPVFRIIRLVKLSPTLESFLYKVSTGVVNVFRHNSYRITSKRVTLSEPISVSLRLATQFSTWNCCSGG